MPGDISDCYFCENNPNRLEELDKPGHKGNVRDGCPAYPEGIPEAVFCSGHKYPKPGDHGIQFKGSLPSELLFMESESEEAENKCYQAWVKFLDKKSLTDEEYLKKYGQKKFY